MISDKSMGRYFFDKKTTAEECKSISIVNMKKWGFFKARTHSGGITWTSYGNKTNIAYDFDREKLRLRLRYTFSNAEDDPKAKQDYYVRMSTTPCQFGGVRYWMHCPQCGKRSGKLFLAGKYVFACRTCWNLSYQSQNFVGFERALGSTISCDELDRMRVEMRITHYKGKQTKKYRKFLKYEKKLNWAFHLMAKIDRKWMRKEIY